MTEIKRYSMYILLILVGIVAIFCLKYSTTADIAMAIIDYNGSAVSIAVVIIAIINMITLIIVSSGTRPAIFAATTSVAIVLFALIIEGHIATYIYAIASNVFAFIALMELEKYKMAYFTKAILCFVLFAILFNIVDPL